MINIHSLVSVIGLNVLKKNTGNALDSDYLPSCGRNGSRPSVPMNGTFICCLNLTGAWVLACWWAGDPQALAHLPRRPEKKGRHDSAASLEAEAAHSRFDIAVKATCTAGTPFQRLFLSEFSNNYKGLDNLQRCTKEMSASSGPPKPSRAFSIPFT
jgi:hypothetical protein